MEHQRIIDPRAVIYIKDVMRITGKKLTAARNLYHSVLQAFQKVPGQFVTVTEFSMYTGIETETIMKYLQ